MTHECVSYVVDFVRANESFVRFYRTAYAADEGVFQTIVMNSEFAGRAAHLDLYQKWRADVRPWTPASRQLEKERMLPREPSARGTSIGVVILTARERSPAVLDMRDFDALRRSDCPLCKEVRQAPLRGAARSDRSAVPVLSLVPDVRPRSRAPSPGHHLDAGSSTRSVSAAKAGRAGRPSRQLPIDLP